MTRYPGAIWKPIDRNYTARKRSRTDCVILHIAVSESPSLYGWFNNPAAGSSSHLYVRRDGITEQYLDMDHISWANGDGNGRSITVETQGMGDGTWTSQQVTALAAICRWANAQYGVPLTLMPDSKRTTRGIGYHRLGCDPYRVAGGEKWSKAYGKICPGPERVPQIPGIIGLAKANPINLASASTTTPTITELQEFIMSEKAEKYLASIDESLKTLVNTFAGAHVDFTASNGNKGKTTFIGAKEQELTLLRQIAAVKQEVTN